MVYQLPEITDPDSDKVLFEFDSPAPCITFSSNQIFVYASANDVGNYTVSITLIDQNQSPLKTKYDLKITIVNIDVSELMSNSTSGSGKGKKIIV